MIGVALIARGYFSLFDGSDDTRRYLLSTVAQSIAALFGITISLVLVAIQLGAQFYTPHATRLLILDDRPFLMVLILNIFTIGSSLVVLSNGNLVNVTSTGLAAADETAVLLLAVACLVTIPIYVRYVFKRLNPVDLTRMLLKSVTLESVMSNTPVWVWGDFFQHFALKPGPHTSDPLGPFSDIFLGLIQRKQYHIIYEMWRLLQAKFVGLVAEIQGEENGARLTGHICAHLRRSVNAIGKDEFFYWVDIALATLLDAMQGELQHRGLTSGQFHLASLVHQLHEDGYDIRVSVFAIAMMAISNWPTDQDSLGTSKARLAVTAATTIRAVGQVEQVINWIQSSYLPTCEDIMKPAADGFREFLVTPIT